MERGGKVTSPWQRGRRGRKEARSYLFLLDYTYALDIFRTTWHLYIVILFFKYLWDTIRNGGEKYIEVHRLSLVRSISHHLEGSKLLSLFNPSCRLDLSPDPSLTLPCELTKCSVVICFTQWSPGRPELTGVAELSRPTSWWWQWHEPIPSSWSMTWPRGW